MCRRMWFGILVIAFAMAGCQTIKYKPYLPEEFRGDPEGPDPSVPGVFTGKSGEYTIYGK